MPVIHLQTSIQAPPERVFNLSRSIDLHTLSTRSTGEQAIAGRTSGLIEMNEQVTWRAWHLGKWRKHTSLITAMQPPVFFEDQMIKGAFACFKHQHHFENRPDGTCMIDILEFASPYGWLGKLADRLFIKNYLTRFLKKRNQMIQEFAESEKWKALIAL